MIYISHGIPKSASTFVYQIIGAAAKRYSESTNIGITNLKILFNAENQGFAELAIKDLKLSSGNDGLCELVELIEKEFDKNGESVIILKTHLGCSDKLSQKIANGDVLASTCFRHPADMLISRMNMLERLGQSGSFESVKRGYSHNAIPKFMTWAANERVEQFFYKTTAKSPESVAEIIAKQFRLSVDPKLLFESLLADTSNIKEFNKGVIDRFKSELDPSEIWNIEQ